MNFMTQKFHEQLAETLRETLYITLFWGGGAFAKLCKATISIMSVCPSARNNLATTIRILIQIGV